MGDHTRRDSRRNVCKQAGTITAEAERERRSTANSLLTDYWSSAATLSWKAFTVGSDSNLSTVVRTVVVSSLVETRALGLALSRVLLRGDVVSLNGELGAGKTAFVQGLARALGIDEAVTSPTFTIMRQYPLVTSATHDGVTQLLHLDAYRLEGPDAIEDLGLFELLDAGAAACIEWGDLVIDAIGPDVLTIRISTDTEEAQISEGLELLKGRESKRTFELSSGSSLWTDRIDRVIETFSSEVPRRSADRQS